MSIQERTYTSKKTGKTKTTYYADVWYAAEGRAIKGKVRAKRAEAVKDEAEILRQIEAGRAPVPRDRKSNTFGQAYDLWHDSTRPPVLANSTWHVYEQFYNNYIKDIFGDKAIGKITAVHVQKYVNAMKEKYSPETVNKCISVLVDVFGYAIDPLRWITENPASGIKRCKVPRKKKTTWNDDMIQYFLNLPEVLASHYYPMLVLSAMLGPRPGEVCGLRDNGLSTTTMQPGKQFVYLINFEFGFDNWEYDTDLKNNGSHRTPPIPKYLYDIIHKRLIWKRKMHLADNTWGNNNYMFVSQNGEPIKPHQYAEGFNRLVDAHNRRIEAHKAEYGKLPTGAMELPEITLYGLRTSFATNNMRRCPNAALVSSVMGNSPKTLMQFYAQGELDMQMELVTQYAEGKVKNA